MAAGARAGLRFCVVGAGPAGFYAAERLLRAFPGGAARVDLLERLPAPFGLVRSGVAPDHPGTKRVEAQFAQTARRPEVRFWGNVELGRDVSLAELRAAFSGVVLASGAAGDRRLGIPGEGGPGLISARTFSQWYNGHPDGWPRRGQVGSGGGLADLTGGVGLADVQEVVVVGQGNVALDCARLLLRDPADLEATDIAAGSLSELRSSAVRRVRVVGRRGPAQAALAPKELREILALPGVGVSLGPPEALELDACDEAAVGRVRRQRRVVEVLRKAAAAAPAVAAGGLKELRFDFLRRPVSFRPEEGRLTLEAMRLEPAEALEERLGSRRRVEGTGEFCEVPAQLVIRAAGWQAQPVPGAPFDCERSVVPSTAGRVSAAGEGGAGGLYVTGWLKRGPQGIIGTNLECAEETVATVLSDANAGCLPPVADDESGLGPLGRLLEDSGARPVTWAEWERLDAAEVERGAAAGKSREKFVDAGEMLALLDNGGVSSSGSSSRG